jgi:hypothetical protein
MTLKWQYINSWRTPTLHVLPFSMSLLYHPDNGPLVGSKNVALVKTFYNITIKDTLVVFDGTNVSVFIVHAQRDGHP